MANLQFPQAPDSADPDPADPNLACYWFNRPHVLEVHWEMNTLENMLVTSV